MAPKKSRIIIPNRCGMYEYDDEYEEMLRSYVETLKRHSECLRERTGGITPSQSRRTYCQSYWSR